MIIKYITELFRNNFRAILSLENIGAAPGSEFGLTRFIPEIILANLKRTILKNLIQRETLNNARKIGPEDYHYNRGD
jgi:hypothetical protein